MWTTPEGKSVDINEDELIPVRVATLVIGNCSVAVAPNSIDKLLNGPATVDESCGNTPRGIIPGCECSHCRRQGTLLVIRAKDSDWQWVMCLQCGGQTQSKDIDR